MVIKYSSLFQMQCKNSSEAAVPHIGVPQNNEYLISMKVVAVPSLLNGKLCFQYTFKILYEKHFETKDSRILKDSIV